MTESFGETEPNACLSQCSQRFDWQKTWRVWKYDFTFISPSIRILQIQTKDQLKLISDAASTLQQFNYLHGTEQQQNGWRFGRHFRLMNKKQKSKKSPLRNHQSPSKFCCFYTQKYCTSFRFYMISSLKPKVKKLHLQTWIKMEESDPPWTGCRSTIAAMIPVRTALLWWWLLPVIKLMSSKTDQNLSRVFCIGHF